MTILLASLLTAFAMQPDAYQLNRTGRDLLDQHRYAAAAHAFRQAAEKADTQIGPQDPATAMILRNLALAYAQTGNSIAAEHTAKRAFSIIESRFGSAEPALTPILNVLAECYASSGRIAEAQRAAERAVEIGPLAGAHYGVALHNLGAIHEYLGDWDGAAAWYRQSIAVKIETLGAAHPYVVLTKQALRRVQQHDSIAVRANGPIKLEIASE
jgi:tetratricopeptide (TPR) repeat protein